MTYFSKAALLVAGLALAACSDNLPYNSGSGTPDTLGTGEIGSVSDPTSIAHFQEAVGDRVLFPVDQSTLSEEGRLVVLAQANWLLANTDYTAVRAMLMSRARGNTTLRWVRAARRRCRR